MRDGHPEHRGDGLALVVDPEGLAVVALAAADLAGDVHVGEELHLDLDDPVAGARFAASSFHVEREPPRGVATQSRLGYRREELAYRREKPAARLRVAPRRPTDPRLRDVDA